MSELAKPVEPSLRQILEMDADPQGALSTIPIIRELVPVYKDTSTLSEVGLAALIYSLSQTRVVTDDGEVKAKWQVASLVKDKEGKWLPLSKTWADFCYTHLGMDPSSASGYKRLWEVFHVNLGMGLDDLRACGIHKLRMAAATVSKLYPEIDIPLHEALFGNEAKCGNCGFEPEGEVDFCPSCGEKFEPMPGGTPAEVALRVKQLGEKPQEEGEFKVLPDLQSILQDNVIVGWRVTPQCWYGDDDSDVSYVAPWDVGIIPDDSPNDALGVKEKHASKFAEWLMRHFG